MTVSKVKSDPETSAPFVPVERSLEDILGREYCEAVCRARSVVAGDPYGQLMESAEEGTDFYPVQFRERLQGFLTRVGEHICPGLAHSAEGAGSAGFEKNSKRAPAPLTGYGYYRVGEDGRLYMTTKSEHYHAPLGHGFPGYALLERARRLGIPNAAHNSARGHITRVLEQALIRGAGNSLDRVLNLETGSLAVEAALKMVLARFYRAEENGQEPEFKDRIPVIAVVGNDGGGLQANYHGTTLLTQTFRGMWKGFCDRMKGAVYEVKAVRPNNREDLKKLFERYDTGKYKVAAFFHEIVMMNYGAVLLTPEFLKYAYDLCDRSGAAKVDDEIQSCLWHHDLFMFREWGLQPDFVAAGKGFPGGEYPASRIIFSSEYDLLPQFGALVTNGQEEIASLAYLVSMAWAEANAEITKGLGDHFEARVRETADAYPDLVASVNGKRHMIGIGFNETGPAQQFAADLNGNGIDISVQSYKTEVPPAALLKLPLIMDREAVDFLVEKIDSSMGRVSDKKY